jgi:tetratricopeptide (TPR) repeat protein/predicted Ser/Thr protein kinase
LTDARDDPRLPDDPRLEGILEACYAAVCDGEEPDLAALCAEAPELRPRVERMLARERSLLQACIADVEKTRRTLPAIPERVGDFVVLEPIGIGGMSHVFRARQEPLGREVALKVLRDDLVQNTTSRLRFTREASITASLDHPHIVPVYAAGEVEGHVYLAMKLLRGRSLDRQEGPFSAEQVARIGIEIASALHAAHEVGVVHRDVKPANIVLEHGHAFVVDFGLAAFADRQSVLTQPNATPGTLIYLPPEVAGRRASNLDPRADVYGVGATIYELLAGHPPFDPGNPVRALHQILHDEPKPLGRRGRERDLETIIGKAMDKSPNRRFQSCRELVDELQRFRAGEPILTRPPHLLLRSWRRAQQHPVTTALLTLIAILAVTLVAQTVSSIGASQRALAQATGRVERALARDDLVAAARHLDTLAEHPDSDAAHGSLRRDWQRERDLQLLLASLAAPQQFCGQELLAALRDRVGAAQDPDSRSPRCEAALLLFRWRTAAVAVPAELQAALPRTAALLASRRTPDAARAALLATDATGGRDDHLLASIALRLAGASAAAIEAELRRVDTDRTPLHEFSRSVALEAQGRRREAYESTLQLVDDPVCGPVATWSAARLAAMLGEPDAARQHIAQASERSTDDALLAEFAYPAQLEVLSELDPQAFWQRWRAAPERTRRLPQYWRLAAYVKVYDAVSVDELDEAIALFEKGLEHGPDAVRRAGLEAGILQTRRARVSWLMDELVEGERDAALDAQLRTLCTEAEELMARSGRDGLPQDLVADALLVAAQCRFDLGQWRAARRLYDRAIELDAPEPLADYARQVSTLAIIELLDARRDGMPPRDALGPLPQAAMLTLERAYRIRTTARRGFNDDPAAVHAADLAVLTCAAYLGRADTALSAAWSWQPQGEALDPNVQLLAERLVEHGGMLLDACAVPDDELPQRMVEAVAAVARGLAAGRYRKGDVERILDGWHGHERLHEVAAGEPFAAFREATALLRQQLR